MLSYLWRYCSAVREVLTSCFYWLTHCLVSQTNELSLSIPEEPDDLERCQRPFSKNDHPAVAKTNVLAFSKDHQPGLPNERADPILYEPHFTETLGQGSASLIARMRPGVVLKYPRYMWWHAEAMGRHPFVQDIKRSFQVEEKFLDLLGTHPRIIRYIGVSDEPRGLLLGEASDGDLQNYIDQHYHDVDLSLRLKWCFQAAEAVHYIHQKGVIHSDLRPENFLLHSDSKSKLDLLLCDFGGSTSGDIDGGHLPDPGFFNPSRPWVSTEAVDIFSLGSIFYTIMTGHWPYKSPGPFTSMAEKYDYEEMVDDLFSRQQYPPVDDLLCGSLIQGCWTERYNDIGATSDLSSEDGFQIIISLNPLGAQGFLKPWVPHFPFTRLEPKGFSLRPGQAAKWARTDQDDSGKSMTADLSSLLQYTKILERWNEKSCKYETIELETIECDSDALDAYTFVIRERVDRKSEQLTRFIDVKSTQLCDVLRGVLHDVRAVNMIGDKPSVEENILFHFLPELENAVKALEMSSDGDRLSLRHLNLLTG
ncbi:uncharacterized protein N7483_007851 [Penicillium malachiteum]|uniref:uncharacterized protein n=1 Tax=Penicillium malachiteum TaxID=1324776 RepID=UPI00254994EE|nr:uncharacterized protein N7483_007851 [Penicillium malachiteum]KAJ5726494.1 hypothetical protein N7483_007851 [Penicillium malachiteum]